MRRRHPHLPTRSQGGFCLASLCICAHDKDRAGASTLPWHPQGPHALPPQREASPGAGIARAGSEVKARG